MELCLRIKHDYHKLLFKLAKYLLMFGLIDRETGTLLMEIQAGLTLAITRKIIDNKHRMVK